MIKVRDLITELKLVLDFDTQCITWDVIDQPMKTQGGSYKKKLLITVTFIKLSWLQQVLYFRMIMMLLVSLDISTQPINVKLVL
jgi:hypothetical protein